jgi:hypothetical protein
MQQAQLVLAMIITSAYSLGQLLLVRNHQDHEYYPAAHNFHLQHCLATAADNASSIPYFLHSSANLVAISSCFILVLTIPFTPLVTSRWKCLPTLVDAYKT